MTEEDLKLVEGLKWSQVWDDGCGYCAFDEAEGGIMDHCKNCCKKLALIALRDERDLDDHLRGVLTERTGINL